MTRRMPRLLVAAGAVVALTAGPSLVAAGPAVAGPAEARFIITVADGYDSRAVAAEHRRRGAAVDFVYTAALNGFAGSMSEAELGELQRDRRVTRIERDGIATASTTHEPATWGLDRIDQRELPLSNTYTSTPTGTGVNAYIIDTGIELGHVEFSNRLGGGYDGVTLGGTGDDCNGHGTHVAGTVGSTTYGVAKAVRLYPVRVLDCNGSGSWSGVIGGLDWVATHRVTPAVANMSLGGGANSSVDDAVRRTVARGVTVVVAAGNGNQAGKEADACSYSPARVPEAITVGATARNDAKTSWSNYGACVDLFAPGAGITSTWHTSNTATNTISGTSMAAPHVAGVAALYLQGVAGAAPAGVAQAIHDASTKGIVTSSRTANNHLVFSGLTVPATVTNAAPTASFTSSCTGLTCTFTNTSADSDGSISSHAWTFGDGGTSTVVSPQHTYGAGSSYTVTLTVTDNAGATGSTSQSVTVTAPSTGGITLSATGYKVKGYQHADLTWSGTTSVAVLRDGVQVASAVMSSPYTDKIDAKGGGSYRYQVCDSAGTALCSPEVTVTF